MTKTPANPPRVARRVATSLRALALEAGMAQLRADLARLRRLIEEDEIALREITARGLAALEPGNRLA